MKSKDNGGNQSNQNNNNNAIYEFSNINFLRDNPEKINLIKRKTKSEKNENISNKPLNIHFNGIKGNELVIHSPRKFLNFKNNDKKKLNLNKMYKKALKLSDLVSNLRKKVEILEGKYDFLEYCNYEFAKNNKNIISKLQKILDKKKTLENLFFYMIRNFFPNIKLVENTFNTNNNKSPSTSIQKNNQMNELRNNEIISQIYKIFNLSDSNLSNNNISGNNNLKTNTSSINNINITNSLTKNNFINNINSSINNSINTINTDENINNKTQIAQLMNQLIDKDQFNVEAREINTYNKIIDFQKKYFSDLDEQNITKNENISFDNKDSQLIENNSINITNNDNNKLDKDLLTVTSNNNSLENNNNQFLTKKTARDADNSISDGSKDLL